MMDAFLMSMTVSEGIVIGSVGGAFADLAIAAVVAVTMFAGCVEEEASAREFSKLETTNIAYEEGNVKVIGITDLPDGSELSVTFDVAATATYIGVNIKVKVENGKFTTILTPPNRPEFAKGPYVVEVMFTPRAQSDVVLKLVGNDGEHLKGDKVRESYGFKIMETSQQIDLPLNIEIVSYPMVSANSYSADSPERALAEYLNCWKQKDWNRMVEFTQKTWRSGKEHPEEHLADRYDLRDLVGAEITKKGVMGGNMVQVEAKVYYFVGAFLREEKITANLIRESAPYTPSSTGDWGVNPISRGL